MMKINNPLWLESDKSGSPSVVTNVTTNTLLFGILYIVIEANTSSVIVKR
jgi:hypothetical protein